MMTFNCVKQVKRLKRQHHLVRRSFVFVNGAGRGLI